MECHRCEHRGKLEAGKYRDVPFEETPCARCELVETSAFTMAFDEERGAAGAEQGASAFAQAPTDMVGSGEGGDDRVPLSVMSEAVAELLALQPVVRDVVCWRFAGMKYRDIAQLQGVTVEAVENRQRRAMQKWPALRGLFAEKAAKQARRKRPRTTEQAEGSNHGWTLKDTDRKGNGSRNSSARSV